jgi:hypothetical protein
MTSINYRYFVHAKWAETSSETPAAIGATFLKTLDALSGVDPFFAGWQVFRNLQIAEDEQPRQVPLDAARKRITEIVESGVARNDYDEPEPIYGYSAVATAGVRGPRYVTLSVHTTLNPDVGLKFGEHNIASDCLKRRCWRSAQWGLCSGRTHRHTEITSSRFRWTWRPASRRSE